MMKVLKATLIGGVLFLIPIAFLALLLGKAFQLSMMVARPIGEYIPIQSVGGVLLADLIAIAVIVALCLLAGLAAQYAVLAAYSRRIDAVLTDIAPGYAVAKSVVGGAVKGDDAMGALKPVAVRFDDYVAVAFEVERTEDAVVVFLPGAPSAWTGSTVLVEPARVRPLDLKPHELVGKLRVLGRGLSGVASAPGAPS